MKRQRRNLSLPAIKKFREAIENGKIGSHLIEYGEKTNAGSIKVTYAYKNRPWRVIIEAKRIFDNKH